MAGERKDINWMYEGTKAIVNREDYLLGKRLDKNFEMYSDTAIPQKRDRIDTVVESGLSRDLQRRRRRGFVDEKISSLKKTTVKMEDPLVAVKVKEETRKRELMENPLMRLKFQRLLKQAMKEKEKEKSGKKHKKEKKRKRSRSSSSSSAAEKPKKHKHKKKRHDSSEDEKEMKKSRTPPRRRHDSDSEDERREKHDSSSRRRHDSDSEDGRRDSKYSRSRHDSCSRGDERKHENRGYRDERARDSGGNLRRRSRSRDRRSRSRSTEKRKKDESPRRKERSPRRSPEAADAMKKRSPSPKSSSDGEKRNFDSHIPEHLRPTGGPDSEEEGGRAGPSREFDVEDRERKAKYEGYGLVGAKKKNKKEEEGAENPYQLTRLPDFRPVHKKAERRAPMTAEEREAKLRAMQENAKWRDSTRHSNLKKRDDDEKKEVEEEQGKSAAFIRPMLNTATSALSVEQRLQSNRKQLQRDPGYMDKTFARK